MPTKEKGAKPEHIHDFRIQTSATFVRNIMATGKPLNLPQAECACGQKAKLTLVLTV